MIGAAVKTSVSCTAWITLLTEAKSAAEEKSGDNATSAAAPGCGFTNGAAFFWVKKLSSNPKFETPKLYYFKAG